MSNTSNGRQPNSIQDFRGRFHNISTYASKSAKEDSKEVENYQQKAKITWWFGIVGLGVVAALDVQVRKKLLKMADNEHAAALKKGTHDVLSKIVEKHSIIPTRLKPFATVMGFTVFAALQIKILESISPSQTNTHLYQKFQETAVMWKRIASFAQENRDMCDKLPEDPPREKGGQMGPKMEAMHALYLRLVSSSIFVISKRDFTPEGFFDFTSAEYNESTPADKNGGN